MSFKLCSLVLVSLLVASASSMHTPYALRDVDRSSTHSSLNLSSAPPQQAPSPSLWSRSSITSIEAVIAATPANPNVGRATWYNTGLTACGTTNQDLQFIVAVSEDLFDNFLGATSNPNNDPICNRQVLITYEGRTVTATITDRCTACQLTDLDMTPSLFQAVIGDLGIGLANGMQWSFL